MSRVPVSCYGKLPFHPEYLRIGIESPAAIWVTNWIDDAHEALSAGKHGKAHPSAVCFSTFCPDGKGTIAGVVRQSSDGLRRHPVVLFVEHRSAPTAITPHLLPLALAENWVALGQILERPFHTVREFTDALTFPSDG